MLRKFKGISPDVDPKAHVFESADVIGMVKMKEFASVWPNCTVRGDVNRIEIGRYSNSRYRQRYRGRRSSDQRHDRGTLSLMAGIPAKCIKKLPETNMKTIHSQAIKYKTLWTEGYGILPDADGESYHGEKIMD